MKVSYKRKPEICEKLKKERKRATDRIYYHRKKGNEKQVQKELKARESLNRKLFKCSDEYDEIQRKKKALRQRIYRRKKKFSDPEVVKKMNKSERIDTFKEIQDYSKAISTLNQITSQETAGSKSKLPEKVKPDRFNFDDDQNMVVESEPIWQWRDLIESAIDKYNIEKIIIKDVGSSSTEDRLSLEQLFFEFETYLASIRSKVGTPYVTASSYLNQLETHVSVITN